MDDGSPIYFVLRGLVDCVHRDHARSGYEAVTDSASNSLLRNGATEFGIRSRIPFQLRIRGTIEDCFPFWALWRPLRALKLAW